MLTTTPSVNRVLEEHASAMLNQWLSFCPLPPREHLSISANDVGEVRLRGMVSAGYPIDEVIRFLWDIPGVDCVFNDVTVVFRGRPIRL